MPSISFRAIRAKFKAQPDPGAVNSDQFLHGNIQNVGPQANVGMQQLYNSQQPYVPQAALYTTQVVNSRPVGHGFNNSQPVSPVQPYDPQDFGRQGMYARPVVELEGHRRTWSAERDEYMSRDDFRRRHVEEQHARNIELAKQKSRQVAEKLEQVEAEKARLERHRNASKESVLHLRELMRERYRLDLDIWRERDALEADRELVLVDCNRADDTLKKMYAIVNMWDEDLFSAEEWKVAKRIKDGLLKLDQHVIWTETPPWKFSGDGELLRDDQAY